MKLNNLFSNKKVLFGAAALFFILILLVSFFILRRPKPADQGSSQAAVKKTEVSQEVVKNVNLEIKKIDENTILFKITNIPAGTKSFEYELTYDTEDKGIQGIIGSVDEVGKNYEKELYLGTCSSGTCVPHLVNGPVNISVRFMGDYGDAVIEKDFDIND